MRVAIGNAGVLAIGASATETDSQAVSAGALCIRVCFCDTVLEIGWARRMRVGGPGPANAYANAWRAGQVGPYTYTKPRIPSWPTLKTRRRRYRRAEHDDEENSGSVIKGATNERETPSRRYKISRNQPERQDRAGRAVLLTRPGFAFVLLGMEMR